MCEEMLGDCFCFDGNLQPWLLTSRVAVRSQKGCPSKSTPVTRIGTARTIRVLRRISTRDKMPKPFSTTDPLSERFQSYHPLWRGSSEPRERVTAELKASLQRS